jgi:hypothetical protein
MPERIQRKRMKGSRLPPGAVCVTRPGRWGNPWREGTTGRTVGPDGKIDRSGKVLSLRDAVVSYRNSMISAPDMLAAARAELAGRDLACWCPLPGPGQPDICHAAVLLHLANSWRTWTPPERLPGGAQQFTVKRCCNGCGDQLGDVSEYEMQAGLAGDPLPDVRWECWRCSAQVSRASFCERETADA